MAWDPNKYLTFDAERARPASELLARVNLETPARIAELGCGPGNSTHLLRARWPRAQIDALDNSPEMLAAARASGVDARFVQADISAWTPEAPCDLIFSNATLHWLRAHETLFPKLLSFLRAGGILAVQMPRNFDEPILTLIADAARDARWAHLLPSPRDVWYAHPPETYFDVLHPVAKDIDLWETRYFLPLEGEDAVFHWIMGTGLRPFAAALDGDMRDAFLDMYRGMVAKAYPRRADGITIYPLRRLFMVVTR